MEKEVILAMAVAAIAEENHTEATKIKVHSFKEIQKKSLEKFIEENHLSYKKYQLEGLVK